VALLSITGKAKLTGVIGDPITHSRSPLIHNYWLKSNNIDGAYLPFRIKPTELDEAILWFKRLGFLGLNVTLPHKEKIMPLCDALSPQAQKIGAVNTVIFTEDGKIIGENSDQFGFISYLDHVFPSWDEAVKIAVIVGAGGAARAVINGLVEKKIPEIRVINRDLSRAYHLCQTLGKNTSKAYSIDDYKNQLLGADLLINTTSMGMNNENNWNYPLNGLNKKAIVYDIVYYPLKTSLLKQAEESGYHTLDGLGMLLHQARLGFETWYKAPAIVDKNLFEHLLSSFTSGLS
jgi:shikimate dehydrogenase